MLKQQCVSTSVSVTFFVIRLLGYFPFYFDNKSGHFKTTWFLLVYPVVFVCSLCTSLNLIFNNFFYDFRVKALTDTANIVIELYSIINFMLLLFIYLSQFFYFNRLLKVGNEAKQTMQITNIASKVLVKIRRCSRIVHVHKQYSSCAIDEISGRTGMEVYFRKRWRLCDGCHYQCVLRFVTFNIPDIRFH